MAKLVYGPQDGKLDQANLISTNIISQGLLSDNSHAYDCFAKQQFSAKLQAFLIQYVLSISSYYSVYK